jgi:hypothetical protein
MRMRSIRRLLAITVVFLLAACADGGQLPWNDDFSDPASGWHAQSDASADVGYSDGVMRILVKSRQTLAWASAEREFADFHLTVDAAQVAGPDDNEYGVQVRMGDKRHFYRFSVSGDGYYRVIKLDGEEQTILGSDWAQAEAIKTGMAVNRLEVICRGTSMVFRVNGERLTQLEDGSYRSGDISLYAGSFFEPDVEIHFDNLSLTEP